MAKLHDIYRQEVIKTLTEQFGYKTVMQVPRIEKITLNMGVGEAVDDKKVLENAVKDLTAISGQKPLITKVRKSVAGFKIREGYPIGCKVTLRGERMCHVVVTAETAKKSNPKPQQKKLRLSFLSIMEKVFLHLIY